MKHRRLFLDRMAPASCKRIAAALALINTSLSKHHCHFINKRVTFSTFETTLFHKLVDVFSHIKQHLKLLLLQTTPGSLVTCHSP